MNLSKHNFREIAKNGCFVYCYLREKSSDCARALSPYYIGFASNAARPTENHKNVPVPKNRTLIRVLKSGLDWDEGLEYERFYIKKYGLKVDKTGILHNLTSGGNASDPNFARRRKKAEWQWRRNYEHLRDYVSTLRLPDLPPATKRLPFDTYRRSPKSIRAFVHWNNLGYPDDDIVKFSDSVNKTIRCIKRLYELRAQGHTLGKWLRPGERISDIEWNILEQRNIF